MQEETQIPEQSYVIYFLATGTYNLAVGCVRLARATIYLTRHIITAVRQAMPYAVHIAKGGKVVDVSKTGDKVDNYHTRYDQSARGNVGESEYQINVKKNA